jgi:hypothetical protein
MKHILVLFFCILVLGVASSVQAQVSSRIITIDAGTTLPDYTTVDDGILCYVKENGNLYFNRKTSGIGWSLIKTSDPTLIDQNSTHRFVADAQIAAWNAGGGTVTSLWELDANGNARPKSVAEADDHWELDANGNIRPK